MAPTFFSARSKRFRLTIGVLTLALLGLLSVLFFSSQSQPEPALSTSNAQKLTALKARTIPISLLTQTFTPRTASAGLVQEYDKVADTVYGQPDFTSGALPTTTNELTLNQPTDLFVYDTGQIFIADTEHNRVLGWHSVDSYQNGDPADLVLGQPDFVTSDAPNPPGADTMNAPTGITVGYDGIIYVSDTGNNRVLVFVPWNICDFYEYYDDIWCIEEDGYIFPEDYWPEFTNWMNAEFVLGQPDFVTSTAAETSMTSLNQPMGLVTDVNDNLVVADHGNNRVLIYQWPFEDGLPASLVVGQVDGASSEILDPPTDFSLNGPTSVTAGVLGNEFYVTDTGNNRILMFNDTPSDPYADAVIGQPDYTSNAPGLGIDKLDGPTGLKMDAGNRLFVADTNNHRVLVFDQSNPDGQADDLFGQPDYDSNTPNNGGLSDSSLFAPTGIATDAAFMDVYIADQGNNRVLQYYQPLLNPVPHIALLDPNGVLAGNDSVTIDVWGAGIIEQTVIEVNGVERVTGNEFLGLSQLTLDASELITTTTLTITLRNPTPGGGQSNPLTFSIYQPQVGDDTAEYVLGQNGFSTKYGEFTHVTAASFDRPSGVTVDPQTGRLFVSDLRNSRVLSWPSSSARANGQPADLVLGQPDFTAWGDNPDATLISPVGLALDSQGNLYVADAGADMIQIFTPPFSNGMSPATAILGVVNPLAVLVDGQDNLYVSDALNHRVLFYEGPVVGGDTTPDKVYGQPNLSSVEPNQGGLPTAVSLNFPAGLAMDEAGNLYVADARNHRVLVYLAGDDGDTTADLVFGQAGDFTTGTPNNGGITAESLNYPFALALDASGTLYVADRDNHRVLSYHQPLTSDHTADAVLGQNGSFTDNLPNNGGRTAGTFHEPIGLAFAEDDTLFVADLFNYRVLAFQTEPIEIEQPPQTEYAIYLPLLTR